MIKQASIKLVKFGYLCVSCLRSTVLESIVCTSYCIVLVNCCYVFSVVLFCAVLIYMSTVQHACIFEFLFIYCSMSASVKTKNMSPVVSYRPQQTLQHDLYSVSVVKSYWPPDYYPADLGPPKDHV